jgi:hypothetical protein
MFSDIFVYLFTFIIFIIKLHINSFLNFERSNLPTLRCLWDWQHSLHRISDTR